MKIPKIKTVLGFLLSQEWQINSITDKYYILTPPAKFEFDKPYYVELPIYENNIDFPSYMLHLSDSVASMHDWDKNELRKLLSIDIQDIQNEINQPAKIRQAKKQILSNFTHFNQHIKTTTTATP